MIVCKGFKKNGREYSCNFIFGGEWGSPELINHQKHHESFEDGKSYFWLGFETKGTFSKITGRDGKN